MTRLHLDQATLLSENAQWQDPSMGWHFSSNSIGTVRPERPHQQSQLGLTASGQLGQGLVDRLHLCGAVLLRKPQHHKMTPRHALIVVNEHGFDERATHGANGGHRLASGFLCDL